MRIPAWALGRAVCVCVGGGGGWRGVARGYRASAVPTSAQTAGLTWAPGRGAPGPAGLIPLVPTSLRAPPSSSETPPPLPRRPLTGGWALLSATLCRRSPALGMGAATAVGPGAGVRARVGESGASAPCTLNTQGRGTVPTIDTPSCRLPILGPFAMVAPSHLWDKGWGRIPTRDLPRTAHAPSSHFGEGLYSPTRVREEWAAGTGERLQDGPPLPQEWKLGVVVYLWL